MYAYIGFVMCFFVGSSSSAYYPQREAPYHAGPNDPFGVEVNRNSFQEPSQKFFWGNQGSNQVGGTGLWAHLTNKFPFLGNMFGRLELPSDYGVPNQYNNVPSTQYGVPGFNQAHFYYQQPLQQQQQQFYQQPQQQQQFYQQPQQQQQYYQQVPQQFRQQFVPSGRDVGLTDDAIIVTPPFVPPLPQPVSPLPQPVSPLPQPVPSPEPGQGYSYNKPQYRLELPHK